MTRWTLGCVAYGNMPGVGWMSTIIRPGIDGTKYLATVYGETPAESEANARAILNVLPPRSDSVGCAGCGMRRTCICAPDCKCPDCAYGLLAPEPASARERPTEMALCEVGGLFLHPNQLYVFRVMDGCGECAKAARAALEPEAKP